MYRSEILRNICITPKFAFWVLINFKLPGNASLKSGIGYKARRTSIFLSYTVTLNTSLKVHLTLLQKQLAKTACKKGRVGSLSLLCDSISIRIHRCVPVRCLCFANRSRSADSSAPSPIQNDSRWPMTWVTNGSGCPWRGPLLCY